MTRLRTGRALKGAMVTAVAVFVCHVILSAGLATARAERQAHSEEAWAGTVAWLAAFVLNTVFVMPLLLWAGMRILREKDCHLLVVGGSLVWFLGAGYGVDGIDSVEGGLLPVPLLLGVVALGALLSIPTAPPD
ncbi:hypothetical protein [Streptomyces sp. CC224B]|uniref:hypothetical protein n=1 Tax=Streptomyces sp. CC224B TaxID=3044571 RepID=UPI0024A7BE47|nr:hypothetical protein [Streptomyces sp. CC224B]